MAIRYDQKTKDEVVAFITKYNAENGRGGQSAAAKKWKLNPITVKAWLSKAGVTTPGKSSRKKTGGKASKPTPKPVKRAYTASNSATDALERMVSIQKEIATLQKEYEALKGKL